MSIKRPGTPAPAIPVTPSSGPALPSAPSLIRLDFVDVSSVIRDGRRAVVGIGKATGEGRATRAAEAREGHPSTDPLAHHPPTSAALKQRKSHDDRDSFFGYPDWTASS